MMNTWKGKLVGLFLAAAIGVAVGEFNLASRTADYLGCKLNPVSAGLGSTCPF